MKGIRQRDGAIRWNLLRDSADPERYVEVFITESWAEHLRLHTMVDFIVSVGSSVVAGIREIRPNARTPTSRLKQFAGYRR